MAGHTSHSICTRCNLFGLQNVHRIDCAEWTLRDVASLKQKAEEWKKAETLQQRVEIFEQHHVRWSEFWRLPYWDPTCMLVVDVMHCILEGLVHYHCRRVLEIDADRASKKDVPPAAFTRAWMPYNELVPPEFHISNDAELRHIDRIQQALVLPFRLEPSDANEGESIFIDKVQLSRKLHANNKQPLKFICYSLGLTDNLQGMTTKKTLADTLIQWVRVYRIVICYRCSFLLSAMLPAVGFWQSNYQAMHPRNDSIHPKCH